MGDFFIKMSTYSMLVILPKSNDFCYDSALSNVRKSYAYQVYY
jgi:hypothetical protein